MLHDDLTRAAAARPNHTALICSGITLTYAELDTQSTLFAQFLTAAGLRKGDRVAVYLGNTPETVIALYGTWKAGGCAVPFGTATPVGRFAGHVKHCGAEWVVAPTARAAAIDTALVGILQSPLCIWAGEKLPAVSGTWFPTTVHPHPNYPPLSPDTAPSDLAAIIYTSGSSGTPKGVMHTHASCSAALDSIVEYLQNSPDDIILSVLQLNFSYGLLQLLATVRTQATLVLENGFGYPYEVVKLFDRYGVTGFAGTPTIWAMLLQLKNMPPDACATVRYITNAAAAIPPPFVPRLAALFPHARIYLMHGMTECFRTAYLPPGEALTNPASIGTPMRNVELWLENEKGERVGTGDVGELVIAGPTLMAGYWNDPEGTEKAMRPRGNTKGPVLYSGDLFRTDERGYFSFVARRDDIIKSRGEKISPVEVEAVLYEMPEVKECRIIGVPDALLGNRLRAEIVLHEGTPLDDERVKAHCIRNLEPYKMPHEVVFVSALPKTAGGKIVRAGPGNGEPHSGTPHHADQ